MRRYRGPFRPLGAFTRAQFSADYTISMFGFNLRQGQQSDWSLTVHSDYGFSVIIRELMRADLDGDNNEEILVFVLVFAQQGTYRAGVVVRAKVNDGGLLAPVPL
jgi:hypothetical protein